MIKPFLRITNRTFLDSLKSPIFIILSLILFILVFNSFKGYFFTTSYPRVTLEEFNEYKESRDTFDNPSTDIYLIPLNEEEKFVYRISSLENSLINELNLPSDEVQKFINFITDNNLSYEEIGQQALLKYNYDCTNFLLSIDSKSTTYEEYINYVNERIGIAKYSEYFARVFSDQFIVNAILIFLIFFSSIFNSDMKNKTLEILKTKVIKSSHFICGKILGAIFAVILSCFAIFTIFNIFLYFHSVTNELSYNFFDLYFYLLIWIVPSIIFVCVITCTFTILFKNGIPSIPIIIVYLFLSMSATISHNSRVILTIQPWSLFIRLGMQTFGFLGSLPDKFNQDVLINRIVILCVSTILFFVSIKLYNNSLNLKVRKNTSDEK